MIAIATSTRADWGLLTPLIAEFRKQEMPYTILASNMHLLPEMGMTIDEIRATGEEPVEIPTAGATIKIERFHARAETFYLQNIQ